MQLEKISLVIGGAGSGKSRWAEALVRAAQKPRTYIATAEAKDPEMLAKIARHQQERGPHWTTVEAPRDLAAAIASLEPGGVALIDCLTMWLSNHLLGKGDLDAAMDDLLAAMAESRAPLVVVSNEVGAGGVPDNALAREFQAVQGRLNQRVAARAGLVVAIIAGLPMPLKGTLPEGLS